MQTKGRMTMNRNLQRGGQPKMTAKKMIGNIVEVALAAAVLTYLGYNSLHTFTFTAPKGQEFLAYLGFGLTGGGLVAYLFIFLWRADTMIKRVTSFLMMLVCGIGEVGTAVFGMYLDTWDRAGFQLTQQDYRTVLFFIGGLALLHFLAFIALKAGDQIRDLFRDDDGDGVINAIDPDYAPRQNPQSQPRQLPTPQPVSQQPVPQHSLDEFLQVSGLTKEQAKARFHDQDSFSQFASGKFSYISNGNMRRMYGELMGANGANPRVGQRH